MKYISDTLILKSKKDIFIYSTKYVHMAAEEVVPVRGNKWYPSVGQSAPPDLTHVKVFEYFDLFPISKNLNFFSFFK